MAKVRKVVLRNGRRPIGCIGSLLFLVLLCGVVFGIRVMTRPRPPAPAQTLPRWEVTEPGGDPSAEVD